MSLRVQELIHSLDQGIWSRLVRWVCVLVAMSGAAVLYDAIAFHNLSCPEGMEAAQLARNLSEGKGYITLCVRPFSMFLLQRHRPDHSPMLKEAHPDLTNPPVYPWALAGVLKLADTISARYGGIFHVKMDKFRIYPADLIIAVFNQTLLLAAAVLLFAIALQLFSRPVAWVSALLFLGTELYWRFSVSGLSTNLLLVWTLALVLSLMRLEDGLQKAKGPKTMLLWAALAGGCIGMGGLTRYAFAWFLVPVVIWLLALFGKRRGQLLMVTLLSCLAVLTPWLARNWQVSGTPFGLASFAAVQGTRSFPEDRLERSLEPSVGQVKPSEYARKLSSNARDIFLNELPKLGGSWISALFLAGLLVPLSTAAPARLRWFLLLCLPCLIIVQALGRTYLSDESPTVNSENLLVLLAPLILVFGVGFFFVLLERLDLGTLFLRFGLIGSFVTVLSLPLIISLLPPRSSPIAYPPYYPPMLAKVGVWMDPGDLVMTDVPWAVAWYGRRQSVLTTMSWKKDFFQITDFMKPVRALYLTPRTTDTKFISTWVKGEEQNWCKFLFEIISKKEVPTGFPLRRAPGNFLFPEQLFLTDLDRWLFKE